MIHRLSSFLAAGLMLISPAALFSNEPEVVTLPAQEVTAFRYETSADLVPSALTFITPDALQNVGAQTVAELLTAVPGLQLRSVTGNRMQAEVNLRGWSSNSGLRTLVLVDGMKLNRPDMRQFNWSQIPVESVDRVEVLRGSQSVLYGSQAVGGVIKITTRKSATKPYAKLAATAGSYGLYGTSLEGGASSTNAYANGNAGYTRQDGYRQNSLWEQTSATFASGIRLGARTEIDFRTAFSQNYQQFPGPLGSTQFKNNPRQSIEPGRDSDEDYVAVNLHLTQNLSSEQTLELNGSTTSSTIAWNLAGIHADSVTRQFALSPQWVSRLSALTTVAGMDLQRDELGLDRFSDKPRTAHTGRADITRESAGGFLHLTHTTTETITLTAGARVEANKLAAAIIEPDKPLVNSSMDNMGWALNTGITWQAAPTVRFWTRADRLYRYPVADEVAAYQGVDLATAFNTALEPEHGWNTEIGVEWTPQSWRFTANTFVQWMQGEIDYKYMVDASTQIYKGLNSNLPNTRRTGAEVTAEYKTGSWTFTADTAWIEAIYTAGEYKGNDRYLVPAWQLGARIDWQPLKTLGFGVDYRYTSGSWSGEDFKNEIARLRPYGILGAQVRYQPLTRLTLYLRGTNLTNKHYATVKYYGGSYPAEGRALQTGLNWSF
ncbi:MAG: TonB-dependent receptor [Verrucomicrobiota bacterium]|nr:TonB-dependent receptor [Verrucomicrobiota bacterium]